MTFAHPWLLLLLVVPLAIGWWELRRRGAEVRLPFDHGKTPRRDRLLAAVLLANALPLVLLAVAVVLLARPQRMLVGETVREVRNIQLLLDISGSMNAQYGRGTRYQAAMAAVRQFAHRRAGDTVALSAFGADVIGWVPLTKDTSAIDQAEPFLDPNRWSDAQTGKTYIGRALEIVKARLDATPGGDRTIVMLTDGGGDDLGVQRSTQLGKMLADAHVTLFAVFVGGNESPVDIQHIAAASGGAMFTPDSPAGLADAFRRIDAMQPARQTPVTRSAVDAMTPFLWAGVAALSLTLASGFGLRFTPW